MQRLIACAVAGMVCCGGAQAHVTLETGTAPADSYYKAVFRVPHGCGGAATTALRVRLPEGLAGVKPMPKPGWQLAIVKAKLPQPLTVEGRTVTERVTEIDWTGGKLPDDEYDEFVLIAKLPAMPGTTLYFPVVQECETGVSRWIEIPAAGKSAADYKDPAPHLTLTRKAAGD